MKKMNFSAALLCALIFLFSGCALTEDPHTEPETVSALQTVTVMFPEGFTVLQIAERLEENGVCAGEDFLKAAAECTSKLLPDGAKDRPFPTEGYVFPDTYEFYVGENAQSVLNRFFDNFETKISDEYKLRAEELGLSLDEVITIASVIQKETGFSSEMPKVSSVIHNRLDSGTMRLECNSSGEYVTECIVPYLSEASNGADPDLLKEQYYDLYNTYIVSGLPAGPICNPGIEAINAALYPEDTDYYFFFSDKDSIYRYSETYSRHCALIEEYGLSTDS